MAAPKPGGFKMSLGGLKKKAGLKVSPLHKDTKRQRLALDDDEADDSHKLQEISGWDAAAGGAVDIGGKKEKEGPRIIPALPNRDWRAEARRRQLAKAPHNEAENGDPMEGLEEPKVQYGLIITKKIEPQESSATETAPPEVEQDNLTEEQRLEKNALEALLNGKSVDEERVIPAQTEQEVFLNDLRNAPDAPTLEAYEAAPIEGFGAALLRGMGWKGEEDDGKNKPTKPKEFKPRPALLGIGAKEEAAIGVELGEWGSGKGKGKGKKFAQSYNPVTLRNKHTGEMITEEELKAKLEAQELVQDEKPEKTRRKYDDDEEDEKKREKRKERGDGEDRHRDRKYDDDYDSERRRDKDRRGDRRRDRGEYSDSDRRRDKRRGRDEEYDSERRKDKRRDRSRDDDSSRKKDKQRDRSRSPDDRTEKRRDRYRSRSRDSKRERDRRDRSKDSDDRRKRRRDYEREDDRKRRHREDKYYK